MKNTQIETNDWDEIITCESRDFSYKFRELMRSRELIEIFVKRDFISMYKQTILGPLWFILQPIITTFIFTIIFGKIANISTGTIPHVLFYFSGLLIWNLFSESMTKNSTFLFDNQSVFSKVYFPRLAVPVSNVLSSTIKFIIQFLVFIVFYLFNLKGNTGVSPNIYLLLLPLYVLITCLISFSLGVIFSSITIKYRDLKFLLSFGVQLLMYGTPVIYPVSVAPERYQFILNLNPLASIIENLRFSIFNVGAFDFNSLVYTIIFSILLFVFAIFIFKNAEKNFLDVV